MFCFDYISRCFIQVITASASVITSKPPSKKRPSPGCHECTEETGSWLCMQLISCTISAYALRFQWTWNAQETQAAAMEQVFAEALGFGGACMIRRLIGMAHTVDMDAIEPPLVRCANGSSNFWLSHVCFTDQCWSTAQQAQMDFVCDTHHAHCYIADTDMCNNMSR